MSLILIIYVFVVSRGSTLLLVSRDLHPVKHSNNKCYVSPLDSYVSPLDSCTHILCLQIRCFGNCLFALIYQIPHAPDALAPLALYLGTLM